MKTVTCSQCGKDFEKKEAFVRDRNFCTKDCMYVYMRQLRSRDNNLFFHKSGQNKIDNILDLDFIHKSSYR